MKVTCWNKQMNIMAENDQDATWLHEWVRSLDDKDILSSHIRLVMGQFLPENQLEITESEFYLTDFPKRNNEYVFIETNSETGSGEEVGVVGLSINSLQEWVNRHWIKLLEKEVKKLKGGDTK